MLSRTLFAEVDIITPGEITFLKFLGILLMFLWVAYLLKELFFSHRRDPMMDLLSTAVSSMTTAIASNSARMEMLEKRQNELITQQRQDTGLIFQRITEWNESIQKVLRDHEHDIAKGGTK